MSRILFLVFIAFLVWLLVRVLGAARKRTADHVDDGAAAPARVETVAQCAWCGVHVPPGVAVTLPDGRVYCSDAHRVAARAATTPVGRGPS